MDRQTEYKLAERFSEPSSWAGIASGAALLGFSLPPGVVQGITLIGAGVACLAAFFLREKGQ